MNFLLGSLIAVSLLALGGVLYLMMVKYPLFKIMHSKIDLENMVDSIEDPIAIINQDYTITRVNKAYTRLIGKDFESILGQKCFSMLRKRSSICEDCTMAETLNTHQPAKIDRSTHPDGAGAISLTFFPYVDKMNLPVPHAVEYIRDITTLEKMNRTLAKANDKARDDLIMAREIHRGLYPERLPKIQKLLLDKYYRPMEEVGGDLYDVISLSDTKTAIFLADVSGHGLPAAFVAALSKMSLFTRLELADDPGELFAALNKDLFSNINTDHYVTAVFAVIDHETNSLKLARAGHPKPVLQRRDELVTMMEAQGTFLGILPDSTYATASYSIQPGDRLYFYSDGVYPIVNKEINKVDPKLFFKQIRTTATIPFEQIVPTIRGDDNEMYTNDDYTLLVAEIT